MMRVADRYTNGLTYTHLIAFGDPIPLVPEGLEERVWFDSVLVPPAASLPWWQSFGDGIDLCYDPTDAPEPVDGRPPVNGEVPSHQVFRPEPINRMPCCPKDVMGGGRFKHLFWLSTDQMSLAMGQLPDRQEATEKPTDTTA